MFWFLFSKSLFYFNDYNLKILCIYLHHFTPFFPSPTRSCPPATSQIHYFCFFNYYCYTHTQNTFCICFSNPQICFYIIIFCYFFVRYLFCLQIVHKILKLVFTSELFIWVCLDKQFLYYSFIHLVYSVMLMAINVVLQKRKLIFHFFITAKSVFLIYKSNLYYICFRDSPSLFLFNVSLLRK